MEAQTKTSFQAIHFFCRLQALRISSDHLILSVVFRLFCLYAGFGLNLNSTRGIAH